MDSTIFKLDPEGYIPDGLPATIWHSIFAHIDNYKDAANIRLTCKRFKIVMTDAATDLRIDATIFRFDLPDSYVILDNKCTSSILPFSNLKHLHVELSVYLRYIEEFNSEVEDNNHPKNEIRRLIIDLYNLLIDKKLRSLYINFIGNYIHFRDGCIDVDLPRTPNIGRLLLRHQEIIHSVVYSDNTKFLIINGDNIIMILLPITLTALEGGTSMDTLDTDMLVMNVKFRESSIGIKLIPCISKLPKRNINIATTLVRIREFPWSGINPNMDIINLTPDVTDIFKMMWEIVHVE